MLDTEVICRVNIVKVLTVINVLFDSPLFFVFLVLVGVIVAIVAVVLGGFVAIAGGLEIIEYKGCLAPWFLHFPCVAIFVPGHWRIHDQAQNTLIKFEHKR